MIFRVKHSKNLPHIEEEEEEVWHIHDASIVVSFKQFRK